MCYFNLLTLKEFYYQTSTNISYLICVYFLNLNYSEILNSFANDWRRDMTLSTLKIFLYKGRLISKISIIPLLSVWCLIIQTFSKLHFSFGLFIKKNSTKILEKQSNTILIFIDLVLEFSKYVYTTKFQAFIIFSFSNFSLNVNNFFDWLMLKIVIFVCKNFMTYKCCKKLN